MIKISTVQKHLWGCQKLLHQRETCKLYLKLKSCKNGNFEETTAGRNINHKHDTYRNNKCKVNCVKDSGGRLVVTECEGEGNNYQKRIQGAKEEDPATRRVLK